MSVETSEGFHFASSLILWQQVHGRHQLPWQQTRDPYRVWLSEIMLQQTQVQTVLGYYERFLARFPNVSVLAAADLDEVLTLWAGLGYYSRARNLHRCAVAVVTECDGVFPRSSVELQRLPGIGPSTSAAIAAFCFGERVAIFDGNVQRVLARFTGFVHDLAVSANSKSLKGVADSLLPHERLDWSMPRYTQGIMDLGATVCLPHQPACGKCPLTQECKSNKADSQGLIPVKTRKLKRQTLQWHWLVARRPDGAVWLSKRPDSGIWASLFCFPWFDDAADMQSCVPAQAANELVQLDALQHTLTHRDLVLKPYVVHVPAEWRPPRPEHKEGRWVHINDVPGVGLPVPVSRLMDLLTAGTT